VAGPCEPVRQHPPACTTAWRPEAAPVLQLRVPENTLARVDGIRGSAAVPALGEHRRHQLPERARKVTLANLGNALADADLEDRLSRLGPVRRRDLQVS
jgi:hypothetical protein